jgi:hypothetical protein
MNLVPVLLTWHSTLYNQHHSHMYVLISWEGRARQRVDYQTSIVASTTIASTDANLFSQVPPLPVLPLCTEAPGITVSF